MNTTLVRSTLAALCRIVLGSSVMIGLASGPLAIAGGGHGGGGHGGGGFGGGRMGGGGFGWGRGGMGGGYYGRGGYGYGGLGGYGFGGFGLGYGMFGMGGMGYGYGYPGYGYGYGYGDGYGLGYSGYGYGSYPGYVYGSGYSDPGYTYSSPGDYTYSSAYGTVPLQAAAPSSFMLPSLGIDERKVSDATGSHIQVVRVHAGSPAERAGLQAGDTIVSANGFLTQDPGNLAWIIDHHTTNGAVTLKVRQVANGQDATLSAMLH